MKSPFWKNTSGFHCFHITECAQHREAKATSCNWKQCEHGIEKPKPHRAIQQILENKFWKSPFWKKPFWFALYRVRSASKGRGHIVQLEAMRTTSRSRSHIVQYNTICLVKQFEHLAPLHKSGDLFETLSELSQTIVGKHNLSEAS